MNTPPNFPNSGFIQFFFGGGCRAPQYPLPYGPVNMLKKQSLQNIYQSKEFFLLDNKIVMIKYIKKYEETLSITQHFITNNLA